MKMETLQGEKYDTSLLENSLTRIVDIINDEGPMLVLYQEKKTKDFYLVDWVGNDSQFNRWLIYRCKPSYINEYIQRKISHHALFISGDNFCYKVDIDTKLNWKGGQRILKKSLPTSYFPLEDVFFEEEDCRNFEKLEEVIQNTQVNEVPENTYTLDSLLLDSKPSLSVISNRVIEELQENKILEEEEVLREFYTTNRYTLSA